MGVDEDLDQHLDLGPLYTSVYVFKEGFSEGEGVLCMQYCKFGNFREGFIFHETLHMRSFMKIKSSGNGEITLLFTDLGNSCPSR